MFYRFIHHHQELTIIWIEDVSCYLLRTCFCPSRRQRQSSPDCVAHSGHAKPLLTWFFCGTIGLSPCLPFSSCQMSKGRTERRGHDRLAQCDGGQPAALSSGARGAHQVQVCPGFGPCGVLQCPALCGVTRYTTRLSFSTCYTYLIVFIHPWSSSFAQRVLWGRVCVGVPMG